MKEWIEFYRAKDYESTYLYTTSGLESAVHLYESFGYQKISAKASDNFGVPLNEIRFELN